MHKFPKVLAILRQWLCLESVGTFGRLTSEATCSCSRCWIYSVTDPSQSLSWASFKYRHLKGCGEQAPWYWNAVICAVRVCFLSLAE